MIPARRRALRRPRPPGLLLAVVALALAGGCARPAEPDRPNVVLVSIDTLRADHLGTYGYARPTSPHIDRLAAGGVVFENAFAPSPWTLPSHASMLTGVSPYRHGAVRADLQIAPDVLTLAERLSRAGYRTAGFVNAPFVGSRFGFARGFALFEERFERRGRDRNEHHERVLAAAAELREPFFLFVHYMDVHLPYHPPKRFNVFRRSAQRPRVGKQLEVQRELADGTRRLTEDEEHALVDFYDGEILAVDSKVEQLLELVRTRFPNTVVLLTSDHGEEFLEHGNLFHARTLYDEVLHVPLVVAGPGVRAGARVTALASLLDVVPTVLALTGQPPASDVQGRSLAGLVAGTEPAAATDDRTLDLQNSGPFGQIAQRGARTAHAKLVRDDLAERTESFDLDRDPGERSPVPPDRRLESVVDALRLPPSATLPAADPKTVESLKALGYL